MVDCKSFKKFRGGIKIEGQDPDTSYPSNPIKGSLYYDSNDSKLYVYDAAAWKSVTDFGSADLSDSIDAINLTTEGTKDLLSYDSGTSKFINRDDTEFTPALMGVSTIFDAIHDLDGDATSPVGGTLSSRFMPVAADSTYATTYSANLCGSPYFNTLAQAGSSSNAVLNPDNAPTGDEAIFQEPEFGEGAEQLGGRDDNSWQTAWYLPAGSYFSPKVAGLYQVDIAIEMDEVDNAVSSTYFEFYIRHESDWQDYDYRIVKYSYAHVENRVAPHIIPGSALLWFHGKEANTQIRVIIVQNSISSYDYQNAADAMSSFTLVVPTGRGS